MATCTVDVEPQSIAGLTCGRMLRDGKCPVHGEQKHPDVHDRPNIDIEQMMRLFAQDA